MTELTQAEFDAFEVEPQDNTVYVTEKCMAAEGFRQMANALERVLAGSGLGHYGDSVMIWAEKPEQFRQACRALGSFTKSADDSHFIVSRAFDGNIKLQVFIARTSLCERVVVRTEEVPEQRIAAVPEKIIPASTREVYEWKCKPSVLTDSPIPAITRQSAAIADEVPF